MNELKILVESFMVNNPSQQEIENFYVNNILIKTSDSIQDILNY